MKTAKEIATDIKTFLDGTNLPSEISGVIVCRDRPKNSKKEDVCISVIANEVGQLQMATINVNIYVPDVQKDGQFIENEVRTRKLQRLFADVLERHHCGFYYFWTDSMTCFGVDGLNEHLINFKLIYKTVNE